MRILILLISLLCISPIVYSQDAESLLNSAEVSLSKEDFESADIYLRGAISKGLDNEDIRYNLALVKQQNGETGHAIANYRRVLFRNPGAADARNNLIHLRNELSEKNGQPKFQRQNNKFLFYNTPQHFLDAGWLILNLLFWTICFYYLRTKKSYLLYSLCALFCILTALCPFVWFVHRDQFGDRFINIQEPRLGELETALVCLKSQEPFYSAPSSESQVVKLCSVGQELLISQTADNWVQARFSDGRTGWISSESVFIEGFN